MLNKVHFKTHDILTSIYIALIYAKRYSKWTLQIIHAFSVYKIPGRRMLTLLPLHREEN